MLRLDRNAMADAETILPGGMMHRVMQDKDTFQV